MAIIRSAKFIKGIVTEDELLEERKPHIAFIGRSNVGKSSVINSLTNVKDLAKTSSFPGRTQEINLFLINKSHYFLDLPGYGYAKISAENRMRLEDLIEWYFFKSPYTQDVIVLIIDAYVGPTDKDLDMLYTFEKEHKNVLIIANKIDRIKPSRLHVALKKIENMVAPHKVIPYSAHKRIGVNEVASEILKPLKTH